MPSGSAQVPGVSVPGQIQTIPLEDVVVQDVSIDEKLEHYLKVHTVILFTWVGVHARILLFPKMTLNSHFYKTFIDLNLKNDSYIFFVNEMS